MEGNRYFNNSRGDDLLGQMRDPSTTGKLETVTTTGGNPGADDQNPACAAGVARALGVKNCAEGSVSQNGATRPKTMQNPVAEKEEESCAELQEMAFDFARQGRNQSLAKMLRHGLPVNLADAKGNTLLMLATCNGNLETARMLLESGAEVDRRNDRGQTPLGGAAFKGHGEIVSLLLDHGADTEADNGGGMTPLMFAALFGRCKVIEQLQAHRASLEHRNCFGLSAGLMVRLSLRIARLS